MIIESSKNSLFMKLSAPANSNSNSKSKLEDIIAFIKSYKETLEKNGFSLNGLCENGEEVYESLIEELVKIHNLNDLESIDKAVMPYHLMDDLFSSEIRELLTTGNIFSVEDQRCYKTMTLIYYQMKDGEIYSITNIPF